MAENKETKDCWVEVIRHLVNTLQSISNQKTYELWVYNWTTINSHDFFSSRSFLKTQFKNADKNNSKYLTMEEVKGLCKSLNIKISKEEMQEAFDHANTKKDKSLKSDSSTSIKYFSL